MRYYEDLVVGERSCFGCYEVTKEEVVAFATRYDPQPFHLDEEAAAQTHFGRLAASGWHTAALMMAMSVRHWHESGGQASLGSPGLDELRWLRPVYPGDVLRCESELLSKRRSASRPELGVTKARTTVFNQHNEPVLIMVANAMIRARGPGDE